MAQNNPIIRNHPWWRTLELVPGSLAWLVIFLPIALSTFAPIVAASFFIVYTIVWFFRSLKLSINLLRSTLRVKEAMKTDWNKLIDSYDHPEKINYEIQKIIHRGGQVRLGRTGKIETRREQRTLFSTRFQSKFRRSKNPSIQKSKEILHAILYVTYKESYQLIRNQ